MEDGDGKRNKILHIWRLLYTKRNTSKYYFSDYMHKSIVRLPWSTNVLTCNHDAIIAHEDAVKMSLSLN